MSTGAVILWIGCAIIAGMISDRKHNGFGTGLLIGGLLNIFGVIIVMCLKPGLPKAPAGLVAVSCPRCNAVQNVAGPYECWQCKARTEVPNTGRRNNLEPSKGFVTGTDANGRPIRYDPDYGG